MESSQVIEKSREFVSLMSEMMSPGNVCFRSYKRYGTEGIENLCVLSESIATGGEGAMASLTIKPGVCSSFRINDGSHAIATIYESNGFKNRMVVLISLAVILVLSVCWIQRKRFP